MSELSSELPLSDWVSVVARDGSQCVLGLSRSVPSSPGERERSPSDKFSPEGRRPAAPTSSSTSPPAEQGAKVRTRMIPSAYGLYTYYHITGVQQCFFALSVPIRADLALIIVKVRQAFCCETEWFLSFNWDDEGKTGAPTTIFHKYCNKNRNAKFNFFIQLLTFS